MGLGTHDSRQVFFEGAHYGNDGWSERLRMVRL